MTPHYGCEKKSHFQPSFNMRIQDGEPNWCFHMEPLVFEHECYIKAMPMGKEETPGGRRRRQEDFVGSLASCSNNKIANNQNLPIVIIIL